MGYQLTLRTPRPGALPDSVLRMSVWEMSQVRDRMLMCGAAFCASPPADLFDLEARHDGRESGIPAYKLSMIDGFLVRPDEISEALRIIGRTDDDQVDGDVWKSWIDFLRLALESGGFLVE